MILKTNLIFRLIVGNRETVGHLNRVFVNGTWKKQMKRSGVIIVLLAAFALSAS